MMVLPEKTHQVLCSWEFRENGEKSGSLEEAMNIFWDADMPEIQTLKMNILSVRHSRRPCGGGGGGGRFFILES